jgi:hypothetical protein
MSRSKRFLCGSAAVIFFALVLTGCRNSSDYVDDGGGTEPPVDEVGLLDDFDGEVGLNRYGGGWFFYDDNDQVSNDPSSPGARGTSQILSGLRVGSEWHFGDNSLEQNGYSGTKSGKFEFSLGGSVPMDGYVQFPYVGMGTTLAPEGRPVGAKFNSAASVSFWARANSAMVVAFIVNATETSVSYAFYQRNISVTTQWKKFEIGLSTADLSQPDWTPDNAVAPFNKANILNFHWEIRGEDNPALTNGTLLLDEVIVNGYAP